MMITSDDPVSKGAQRFEIFTGAGKRREWPPEVKASIVADWALLAEAHVRTLWRRCDQEHLERISSE